MTFDEFQEEYEDLVRDVSFAEHPSYERKLSDFLDFLDQSEFSAPVLANLEARSEFEPWYDKGAKSMRSMAGSGELDWAKDRTERLGQTLALFRHFSNTRLAFSTYAIRFTSSGNNYNDMISSINRDLFDPFARNLLKYIKRGGAKALAPLHVPEEDRIVQLDRSSEEAKAFDGKLQDLEQRVSGDNELGAEGPEIKARILAEIGAGRKLLSAGTVRIRAIWSVLAPVLYWLGEKFADQAVGMLAGSLLTALIGMLGITVA